MFLGPSWGLTAPGVTTLEPTSGLTAETPTFYRFAATTNAQGTSAFADGPSTPKCGRSFGDSIGVGTG